eukprot:5856795-Amphidinium_carterae.1
MKAVRTTSDGASSYSLTCTHISRVQALHGAPARCCIGKGCMTWKYMSYKGSKYGAKYDGKYGKGGTKSETWSGKADSWAPDHGWSGKNWGKGSSGGNGWEVPAEDDARKGRIQVPKRPCVGTPIPTGQPFTHKTICLSCAWLRLTACGLAPDCRQLQHGPPSCDGNLVRRKIYPCSSRRSLTA